MIELNCSYEESKKILELGYDFSKVCWKSQYWYNSDGIAEHIHGTGLLLSTIEYRIKSNGCKDAVITGVIPIIPKAALEACLPTTLSFGFNEDVYLMYEYCDKEFQYYQSPDYYCSDGKIYYSSKSAYEAFIWCHENYPEELRKKFKEVMG